MTSLDELEALLEKVRGREWYAEAKMVFCEVSGDPEGDKVDYERVTDTMDNNKFIAAIRHAAPSLIAAAREGEKMREALQWFIDDIDGTHTVMVDFDANVARARAALAKETP